MTILSEIAAHLETGPTDVERFIYAAPARYQTFTIPKRDGTRREIAQPSAALKVIQRFIVDEKLSRLPVHSAAAAYVKGKGIVDNAEIHRRSRFILKLDFEKFFPSITVSDWRRFIRTVEPEGIDPADSRHYERILFWGDGGFTPKKLCIGAPSSPAVSNLLMASFDSEVADAARFYRARYTRYADDITLSADSRDALLNLERQIESYVHRMKSPKLKLNAKKRGLYGPGERRMVTGLVITPESKVSLGRARKRLISAMMDRARKGELDIVGVGKLKGYLGFAVAVEPSFVTRLRGKYGDAIVTQIMKTQLPPRAY